MNLSGLCGGRGTGFKMEEGLLSIKDFAKLTRTTRDTLIYYDKIGLLSPVSRGENNYRFYSNKQLAVVNLIRTLQKLGMTLVEIKKAKDGRTPELADLYLMKQVSKIDGKIEEWVRAKKLLLTLRDSIHSALDVDTEKINILYLPEESIILGGLNDYKNNGTDYDALMDFYRETGKRYPGIDLNYPVWGIFSKERIINRDWSWPDRYYFYNPEGPDIKPAALYAVGYTRGGYGQSGGLYRRMLEYINSNGFTVCGDAYEEYPLNEICVVDCENYLIRVMIMVQIIN